MQLPLLEDVHECLGSHNYRSFKVLEEVNPLVVGFLESIKYSLSMLCGEAVSYGFFCFLDTFLEPASISCKLFPRSFPILLAAYVILSNFFKEGYLEKTKSFSKTLTKHSCKRSLIFICTYYFNRSY